MGEEGSEIEIVSEDDEAVLLREGEDHSIGGVGRPHVVPMDGVDTSTTQPLNPARREVHVEEDLHDAARGSSCSAARHAA